MKNRVFVVLILIVFIAIIVSYFLRNSKENNNALNTSYQNIEINKNEMSEKIVKNEIEDKEERMSNNINIIINNKEYNVQLEQNETAKQFYNMIPKRFNMNELNGNEKYVYLDEEFPTNSNVPNKIEVGDIMLFGNNCLVIFYKSFNTSYSYTKIGHIENLNDLGNNNIVVEFKK